MQHQRKILVVDDELICLDQVGRFLQECDYHIVKVASGQDALAVLHEAPNSWDLVLLDKFMENMDGMAVLDHIKTDPVLKVLPVILQTSDSSPEKILEGIRAGAYYYLTKPFTKEQLQAVVANALKQNAFIRSAQEELSNLKERLLGVNAITLTFRTSEQARSTISLLSHIADLTLAHEMGLAELMLNAVEHGNLGISYAEKTILIRENRLDTEINSRLNSPKYVNKVAEINYQRLGNELHFTITDQGTGFDWTPYLEMQIDRIHDNHGRGIAMAKNLAFSSLTYHDCGNCVKATIAPQ